MALTADEVKRLYFKHFGFIPSGSPTTADFVKYHYQKTVGRAPDPEGLNYWVNELDSGNLPTANFGSAFSNAVQTDQKYIDMVDKAYANTPGAVSDPKWEDKLYWVDQLKSGNLTEQNFQTAFSNAVQDHPKHADMVDKAYANTPGAVSDPKWEDKQYWINQLKSGNLSEQNFQTAFSNAVQDHQKYADMVDKAYANTPGAVWDPTEEDKQYWINQLKSGNLTEQNFQTVFKTSVDEYNSRNPQKPPPTPDRVTPTTPTTGLDDLFQPDKFPSSSGTSTSRSDSASSNVSASGASQSSGSYSGLPDWFNKPLLEGLLPTLQEAIKDLPGQVDQWAEKNMAASRSAAKNMLDGHLTSLLADLSKRGLTNSSVASDAVGQAGLNAARMQSGVDLGIMGQADQQKMQIPGLLAGIAGLGQTSTSQSQGSSFGSSIGQSVGSSTGESTSHSSNPLAPYELYAQMLIGMM